MGESAKRVARAGIAECSFCKKKASKVGRIFGGAGVSICEECVERLHQLDAALDRGESDTSASNRPHELTSAMLLAALPRIAATGAQVERELERAIRQLRAHEVSWEAIAQALGHDGTQELLERYSSSL